MFILNTLSSPPLGTFAKLRKHATWSHLARSFAGEVARREGCDFFCNPRDARVRVQRSVGAPRNQHSHPRAIWWTNRLAALSQRALATRSRAWARGHRRRSLVLQCSPERASRL